MCCGSAPAAPESKDLLAIIHPTQSVSEQDQRPSSPRPYISGRLRLSNAHSGFTSTHFQHTLPPSSLSCSSLPSPLLHIRIHHFGSPLHESTGSDYFSENPVMHTFSILASNANDEVISLAQARFDLGVGGEGIIGRTVSVTDQEGELLGQGVIGRM